MKAAEYLQQQLGQAHLIIAQLYEVIDNLEAKVRQLEKEKPPEQLLNGKDLMAGD